MFVGNFELGFQIVFILLETLSSNLAYFSKGNCIADILSKKALSGIKWFWSFGLPDYCLQAYWFDLLGWSAYRFT